jgi:predicted Fe-Mo cluster-binding NifX family protein
MIIAIPTDENHSGSSICVSFGRAPYFLFYDTEKDTRDFIANPAAQATGGAGIKAAQFVVDHKADTLITVRAGQNAAEVLKAADIKVFQAVNGPVEHNLGQFNEGKLAELTSFHPGFHGKQP